MFCEKLPNGKVRYGERYKDPLTLKSRKVFVQMDKDTPSNRKKAMSELALRIEKKCIITEFSDITFQQLLDEYLHYQLHTVKKTTHRRNKCTLQRFVDTIGPSVRVNSVNARYITNLYLPKTDDEITTSNEYIKRIKAMLRWGYDNELIKNYDLPAKLQLFKSKITKREKIKDKFLEPEELAGILSYLENHKLYEWYYLTKFLALSGLRIGEALALNNSDIDTKTGNISVTKTIELNEQFLSTPKSFTSVRDVFIQAELEEVILEYKQFKENHLTNISNTFFCTKDGNRLKYDAYRKQLRLAAATVTQKKVTPHILRHTHTSLLSAQGVSIETITRRLGHSDSNITKEIYLHVTKLVIEKDNNQLRNVYLL
ncbi:MAG: site-specific integrase [Lachnospiraceae bacterium]|nr:site-specific integrase [Lachnospiraceae bacterium]